MTQDIFLIGCGQTPFAEHWDKGIRELIEEAVDAALETSPVNVLDIDFVIVGNVLAERVSDQAQLGALAASLLPHHPPALRVEAACASGSVAVHTALSLLESNRAETVLVIGVEKMTDASTREIAAGLMSAADAEKDIPSGLTFPGIFGLIAQKYMHDYNLTREQLNLVSARHHANAVDNIYAQFRTAIPPEKIGESPIIADPLRLLDCSPISDGAAAVILSRKHSSPIRIAASQLSTDTLSLADRPSITSFAATCEAAKRAYDEAGITTDDISHIELHDCFSIAALVDLEDMGFAEPGEGISFYEEKMPFPTVNASGGLKACGHPVGATGVKQIVELHKQLTKSQKRWGIAQNIGAAGSTCAIHILEHTT
ncbi:MAG: beta-ketoacyl synthase N-terminal-like domain-containing protein [Candidatus Peribacteraceae bacterium]